MKRLIRKAEPVLLDVDVDIQIGEEAHLSQDEKYKDLTMNDLSRPSSRDGAVLVDSKDNVVRWGLNGETHAQLFEKYYSDVVEDTNAMNYETDSYVVPGVYLKNFLGYETIILYNDEIENIENVIKSENPSIKVYVDTWAEDEIQRIAKRVR